MQIVINDTKVVIERYGCAITVELFDAEEAKKFAMELIFKEFDK